MLRRFIQWYALRFRFPHRGLKYLLAALKWQDLLGHDFLKRLPNGCLVRCQLGEHIERQIFWYDGYELPELQWLRAHLAGQQQPVLYDVGANIGFHSLYLAHELPQLQSWCFEPAPVNLERLRYNLQLNAGVDARLHIAPVALGATRSQLPLYEAGADNRGMHSLAAAEALRPGTLVEVWALDEWRQAQQVPIHPPSCIKLDIEGGEWQALQGMQQLLAQYRPTLCIELDDRHLHRFGSSAQAIVAWLAQRGYDAFQIAPNGQLGPLTLAGAPISLAIFLPR